MVLIKKQNMEGSRNILLGAALRYARQGFYVFPVAPRGKTPLIKDWPNQATTNEEQIRKWWAKWCDANVGIACGPSGLVVIDMDLEKEVKNED